MSDGPNPLIPIPRGPVPLAPPPRLCRHRRNSQLLRPVNVGSQNLFDPPGAPVQLVCTGAPTDPTFGDQLKTWSPRQPGYGMKEFARELRWLHRDEAGQGLVEYALIMVLLAFAAVVAMRTLANDINNTFVGIGSILTSYLP